MALGRKLKPIFQERRHGERWQQSAVANLNEPQPYCEFWQSHGQTKLLLSSEDDDLTLGAPRYENAFEDPLLGEMSRAIASELQVETSGGKLMLESLASSMAARLVQKYIGASAAQSVTFSRKSGARPTQPLPCAGLHRSKP